MIKAIFFDFDGVIVESVDIKTNAFVILFEREEAHIIKKIVNYHLENTGVSRYEKFRHIYKEILKRSLSEIGFNELCNKFSDLVKNGVINAPYVEGALEFLETYFDMYECFVVSATPQKELEEIIKERNINSFFKGIYGAPTPKIDIVRNVLITRGIDPLNAVYIGDALSDYMAAVYNDVKFIVRINGNEDIFAASDCLKIKNLMVLKSIIDSSV